MNEGGEVSDREKEIKTLVEGGSDVEFMMGIEPYIKKDFLAQYGSEIKEPMMDPEARPKDMFSTVNVRLGNRRGIAGTYLLSDSGLIKEGDKAIKDLQEVGLENLNEEQKRDLQLFIQKHNKRKKQTPSEKAEEAFGLNQGELQDKPKSFIPTKDASFVSLRQGDHTADLEELKALGITDELGLDSKGNPRLTKPEDLAITFIHEARHKAVRRLNFESEINDTLYHIPDIRGGAEEILMRWMDYENSRTTEQAVNQIRWIKNFYDQLNFIAKRAYEQGSITRPVTYTDPFKNTPEGKKEAEKLKKLSNKLNKEAKKELAKLRGVPVYEDKDYRETFLEKVDRQGFIKAMLADRH